MEFLQPTTWAEALQMKSAHPEAMPIAGGTDVMVEINLDRHPAGVDHRPHSRWRAHRVGNGR